MTIRADILEAKAVYESHVAQHKCRAGEGNGKPASCPERVRLWHDYMRTANRWGTEADDESRRKAFYGQVQLWSAKTVRPSQSVTTHSAIRLRVRTIS